MSMQTNVGNKAAAPASWLVQRLGQAIAAAVMRRAIWKAEADLMALSDRALRDIGLNRGAIPAAVREALAAGEIGAQSPAQS